MAPEAIKGHKTAADLATKHEQRPIQIAAWKREAVEKLSTVFDEKGVEREKSRDSEQTQDLQPLSWGRSHARHLLDRVSLQVRAQAEIKKRLTNFHQRRWESSGGTRLFSTFIQ